MIKEEINKLKLTRDGIDSQIKMLEIILREQENCYEDFIEKDFIIN